MSGPNRGPSFQRGAPPPQQARQGESQGNSLTFLADAIAGGIDRNFITAAKSCGQELKNGNLTTHQIRNVFGSVQKLRLRNATQSELKQGDWEEFLLLQAYLEYAAERAKNSAARHLRDVLIRGIQAVDQAANPVKRKQAFDRFCEGFEAILAYHRAAGGR